MEGIALITVFTMFFIELLASRFEIFGHEHGESAVVVPEYKDQSGSDIVGGDGMYMLSLLVSYHQVLKREQCLAKQPTDSPR